MEALDNLDYERNLLTKLISTEQSKTFVYDKNLNFKVKDILIEFTDPNSNRHGYEEQTSSEKLIFLFNNYQLGVIKCILNNVHLLYSTHNLEDQLRPILKRVVTICDSNSEIKRELFREIDAHCLSFNDSSKKITAILADNILKEKSDFDEILKGEFKTVFKEITFQILNRRRQFIDLQLFFLRGEFTRSKDKDYFKFHVQPLLKSFSEQGSDVFKFTINAYLRNEYGSQGFMVVAIFGDHVAEWLDSSPNPAPNPKLVRAILNAIYYCSNRNNKETILNRLVNVWANDNDVAKILKMEISEKLAQTRGRFLSSFGYALAENVKRFVDSAKKDSNFNFHVHNLMTLALQEKRFEIKNYIQEHYCAKESAVAIKNLSNEKNKILLFKVFKENNFYRLNKIFARTLLKPEYFGTLPYYIQYGLLIHKPFFQTYNLEAMERIKVFCKEKLLEILLQRIIDKRNSLNKLLQ